MASLTSVLQGPCQSLSKAKEQHKTRTRKANIASRIATNRRCTHWDMGQQEEGSPGTTPGCERAALTKICARPCHRHTASGPAVDAKPEPSRHNRSLPRSEAHASQRVRAGPTTRIDRRPLASPPPGKTRGGGTLQACKIPSNEVGLTRGRSTVAKQQQQWQEQQMDTKMVLTSFAALNSARFRLSSFVSAQDLSRADFFADSASRVFSSSWSARDTRMWGREKRLRSQQTGSLTCGDGTLAVLEILGRSRKTGSSVLRSRETGYVTGGNNDGPGQRIGVSARWE